MKLVVAAVHDGKVGAFMQPFFTRSRGEAIRSFVDAVNDGQSSFGKHPEDFVLFFIAEYDDSSALFLAGSAPVVLVTALDAVNMK